MAFTLGIGLSCCLISDNDFGFEVSITIGFEIKIAAIQRNRV
jgi:hypothetical protein